jgi:choice-of-anchor C domain-containing protein
MANSSSAGGGKSLSVGTRNGDVLTGTDDHDKVIGGNGSDVLIGKAGDDEIFGGAGDDTIHAGAGNDELKGDSGNDILDGGAGSDEVEGGSGNDVAIYVMSENAGSRDEYDGGAGADTLRLVFTREEWLRPDVQSDVARYFAFIAANTNASGQATGHEFQFTAFGLEATKFEKLEVMVDGQMLDPRDQLADAIDDTAAATEDGSVSGNVLANDNVPDLVRSVELVTGPTQGQLTFNADGSYTYVPGTYFNALAQGETATQTFTYRVTDADGDTDTATVAITITGTNDGPVLTADTATGTENQTLVIDVLSNDSDPDHNAALHVAAASVATGGGTVTVNNDNTLAFNPGSDFDHLAQGAIATVVVSYTVSDEHGATDEKAVIITITGTNDAPVMEVVSASGGASEDDALSASGQFTASDVDDGATLTWSVQHTGAGVYGTPSVDQNGQWSYVLNNGASDVQSLAAGQVVTETFTVQVADEHGATATHEVTVSVTGTNDVPVVATVDVTGGVIESGAPSGSLVDTGTLAFTDLDLTDAHSISTVNPSAGALGTLTAAVTTDTTNGTSGVVTWTYSVDASAVEYLAAGETKVESFTLNVVDEHGGSVPRTVSVTLTGTNDAPVITAADTIGAVTAVTVEPEAAAAPLMFTVQQYLGFQSNDLTTLRNYATTHAASYAAQTSIIDYTDDPGGFAGELPGSNRWPAAEAQNVTGTGGINNVFFARITADFSVSTDDTYTFRTYNDDGVFLLIDNTLVISDAGYHPEAPFQGSIALAPGNHTIELFFFENGGEASLEFSARNSTGTFGLVGANGGGLGGAVSQVTDSGVITFSDVDLTDAHLVSATPVGGTLGTLTATKNTDTTGTGTAAQLTWSYAVANSAIAYLEDGETKVESFTVTLNDQHGGVVTRQVDVTITGTNDAPVITGGPTSGAVTEDGASVASGQLTALDVDHGAQQFWAVQGGTPSGNADFHFDMDSLTIVRNGSVLFQDNFSDGIAPPKGPDGVTTSYTGIGSAVMTESDGRLHLDSGGAVSFIGVGNPDPVVGVNAIVRTNIDPASTAGLKSSQNFTVTGVFDLVLPDSPRENYGIRLTDRVVGGNGTPPDQLGDNVVEMRVSENAAGELGVRLRQLSFVDDTVTTLQSIMLAPPPGADQIRLNLTHSTGHVGDVTGTFEYLQAGAVIGTQAFSAAGHIFQGENFTRAELIASAPAINDSLLGGTYGTLNVDQTGTWTYTLDNTRAATQALAEGEHATDTFTMQVADEHGAADTRVINVDVTGANDGPIMQTATVSRAFSEDVNVTSGNLTATGEGQFADVDVADSHTMSAVLSSATLSTGAPISAGLAAVLSTAVTTSLLDPATGDGHGQYRWDFALANNAVQSLGVGQTLNVTYNVTATDNHGAAATQQVNVTIAGANDGPTAVNDSVIANEDAPLVLSAASLLANDTDVDSGDTKSLISLQGASHGTVSLSGGNVTFTPEANYNGAASFSYTMKDTAGATSTATVNVTVNPVNDAPAINSTLRGGTILFVDDDRGLNGQSTWLTALAAKGYTVDYEAIAANGDPVRDLTGYGAVIWSNGDQAYTNLTAENVATLQAYLNSGGRLLYAGGHDLYDEPYVTAAGFAQNYLGVNNYNYNMPYISAGTPASGELGAVTLSPWAGGYYGGTMISGFNAIGGTSRTLLELTGGNDIAAINSTSTFRAATWSFDLNQLDAPYRNNVLDQTLKALGIGLSTNEDTPLSLAGLAVSDVDAGTLSVVLSAGHGDLGVTAVAGLSGLTGNGSGSLTLNGSAAALNQALVTLSYTPDANYNGADALNVGLSDLGNSGSGGALTASASYAITVRPVSDTHVLSNLITNGSFEQFSGVGTSAGSTTITGWTVTGSDVDRVASSGWQSGDGSYSLDLNGFHPGGVQQVLATTPGVQYTVGFELSKNPGNTDHATALVSAAGSSQSYTFSDANSSGDMKWSQQSFTFVATGTSTTVSFASTYPTDATGGFPVNAQGPALDEVVIVSNKTIDSFTKGAGGDVLQLHDVLSSVNAPHDGTAFTGGYLRFAASGSDTLVQLDANGGGDSFLTLATLSNTLLAQADTANYTL